MAVITPLLAKYWEKLGGRLGDGPESLERVPEALARVTELLWRRALEEARERLKIFRGPDHASSRLEELEDQIGKLSIALVEVRAREGEQLTHLATLSTDRERLGRDRTSLMALLKSCQLLLEQQTARVEALQMSQAERSRPRQKISSRTRSKKSALSQSKRRSVAIVRGKKRPSKPK